MELSPINKYYKYCIVPMCSNTSFKTPNKVFIRIPKDKNRRIKWLEACRRNANDISEKNTAVNVCEDHFNLKEDMDNYVKFKLVGGLKKMKPNVVPHKFDLPEGKNTLSQLPGSVSHKPVKRRKRNNVAASTHTLPKEDVCCIKIDPEGVHLTQPSGTVENIDIFIKSELGCDVKATTTLLEATSFVKKECRNLKSEQDYSSFCLDTKDVHEEEDTDFESLSLKCTITKMQNRPRLYMGLPDDAQFIIQALETYCKIPSLNIFLTLKKIRMGESFISLADDFGTSEESAIKIFVESLPVISNYLGKCIIVPQTASVKSNLPLAFQGQYSDVFCIITCVEIEIEKPQNKIKHFLTWSSYKRCNTIKFLISCTPDGSIIFISTAFGGRTSDANIVEHSGFLDHLPPDVAIMVHKSFRHIEQLLLVKGCEVVRPPSISASIESSKTKVLEENNMTIHVTRVMSELRKFSCMTFCIDSKLIPYMDQISKIACGLVNLQSNEAFRR